jgi:ketol-acid reductoisomerase
MATPEEEMTKPSVDPKQAPVGLVSARVSVLGYGAGAREYALALRSAGSDVTVGIHSGGMAGVRARADGFQPRPFSTVVGGAEVVVVLVPDEDQTSLYWHAIEPHLAPGALLVFARGLALQAGGFEPRSNDVVLVTGEHGGPRASCRVAVQHDATGRALDRAIAYARAAFGADATVGTTTIDAEVDAELAALEAREGSLTALLASVESSAARIRESHAPEFAKLAFYEGLRELVDRRANPSGTPVERRSATSVVGRPGDNGGRA